MTLLAIPLSHAIYFACLISASLARKVDWRGITYELITPRIVRLVEYRPFQTCESASERRSSVI